jgi:twitching motility protein PilT
MLAESMTAILSQNLLPKKNGPGRVAAFEVLTGTSAIRNLIREDKVAQIYSVMQTSAAAGMQTMAQAVTTLQKAEQISSAVAHALIH